MEAKNVVITFIATVRFGWLSRDFLTAFIPSAFGMLVYNDFTSRDARWELSGTNSVRVAVSYIVSAILFLL